MASVRLYDTILRDGAQKEGISFSVTDKLAITRKLDELGIHFVEGGWPGSNPKDVEFFTLAKDLRLRNSELVAFGSTRPSASRAEDNANLQSLAGVGVKTVTIVGKSSELQVIRVLETSLEENLTMIADSVGYLRAKGLTVFFDAEHFFDGFKTNPDYSLRCLEAAADAGAGCLVLCDTNGGSLPDEIATAIGVVRDKTSVALGIHTHNDGGLAVANTLAAVAGGVSQVQGTVNGYGERCGNADLCSIIPALRLKMGIDCITDAGLAKLTGVSHYISEVANLALDPSSPYVGSSAFSHKGGLHVSGLAKWAESYQHIDPARVGNQSRVVVSELSGKGNIIYKAREMGLDLPSRGEQVKKLLEQVKSLESRGFQYENAGASFELLVHRAKPDYRPSFELVDFMVMVERRRRLPTIAELEDMLSEATVKVKVGGAIIHTAAEGNGPVNALDHALRKALLQFYPSLAAVRLVDYKVRILEESVGTESQVRVLIESSDGVHEWRTVGSSANIIEASWLALADSLEYWLLKQKPDREKGAKADGD
ncbi:MAG: citramalate synthase [Dehalococcoidales bacterium]|nr:citramalate synthase [Dehalococcoidales bacterium]